MRTLATRCWFTATFLLVLSQASFSETFEFAVIGDLPYKVKTHAKDSESDALFADLNAHELAWVLHVGDIKTGGSQCSDAMFADRESRFSTIQHPFILTPGDNEWTDCHRTLAGGYDPIERLNRLREIFYSQDKLTQLSSSLNLATQASIQTQHSEFIENFHWQKSGVHFATIHVVGSSNGREKFSKLSKVKREKRHKQEVKRREKAAIDWLKHTFAEARDSNAKALFIAIHANTGLGKRDKSEKGPFAFFNSQLAKELKRFQPPVVLAHGDSHYFRIDKPSIDGARAAPDNFLRLESFGDNNSAWIKVAVDPASRQVFSFSVYD
jgi:hypothetical protein